MTGLRTLFSAAVLGAALWLPSGAVQASDVTVDYSQLDNSQNSLAAFEASNVNEPIHLHPLIAAMNSPTVKNLAAADTKTEIHLHPPVPKMAMAVPVAAPVSNPDQPMFAPITNIDLSMAAVPTVKPTEEVAKVDAAVSEAPKPTEETAKADAAPDADASAEVPASKTDIALDHATILVKPKPVAPPPAEALAAAAPTPALPRAPSKPANDEMPPGFMRVNAVAGKMDDLTPEDVVGIDLGPPQKAINN